ncbi:MAG TPA: hypothetical protein VFQ43_20260, partial [Nitrososphaera sp.]|nr:hypothetical protein [Nitrososphaera sp.]
LPASLIHCAKHTVLLVNVYSNVIHENSSFLFLSTLCTEGLLSFYLTPRLTPLSLTWSQIQRLRTIGDPKISLPVRQERGVNKTPVEKLFDLLLLNLHR